MDPDRIKRRQSLKIIISEAVMVLSVVFMVVILAFLVSGYWINSDFKLERQGLLQISSFPTGATVNIDGDSAWFQHTNTSKILPSGEHSVVLTKDGYDSWSKTINITEGLLYRLHYPRLFYQNAVVEKVVTGKAATFSRFSPDGNQLLLLNNSTTWRLLSLNNEDIKSTTIDVSELFNVTLSTDPYAMNVGEVISLDWDQDNSHVLLAMKFGDITEWILLDIYNIDNSLNLSETFDIDFSKVSILDHSSNNLLAVAGGALRKIDVSSRSLSSVLVSNVASYDHYDSNEIILSASDSTPSPNEEASYYIGILRPSNGDITKLLDTHSATQVAIGKFYDDKYIVSVQDNSLNLYAYNNLNEKAEYTLSFYPDSIRVGRDGEFVMAYSGTQIATLDMEARSVTEWSIDSAEFGWLDSNMTYSVADNGDLIVYDYDGLNRRTVAHDAAVDSPAIITDNKWLYFFSDGYLVRKKIVD